MIFFSLKKVRLLGTLEYKVSFLETFQSSE